MIFDEIDRGLGALRRMRWGGVCRVWRRMRRFWLAHSPQVAALGDRHFQVAKQQSADMTLSRVDLLSYTARR